MCGIDAKKLQRWNGKVRKHNSFLTQTKQYISLNNFDSLLLLSSGDLRTAANAAVGYIQLYLFSGLPLSFLAKDIDSILAVMIDYK